MTNLLNVKTCHFNDVLQGAYLTEQQAWEVLEMEEVFYRIVQVCGEMEAVRCDTCGKNHKFSI